MKQQMQIMTQWLDDMLWWLELMIAKDKPILLHNANCKANWSKYRHYQGWMLELKQVHNMTPTPPMAPPRPFCMSFGPEKMDSCLYMASSITEL